MSNGSDEEIPKVWSDLRWAIAERESLRETMPIVVPGAPPVPPYDFHGFEVTAWILGGMGMVLLGRDPKLDRKVALKLLQSSGPEADAALIAEAQTLAKLSHPNVVTVHAVLEWEGGVFFVMEYVDGMNGQQWLKQQPTWQEVRDVFIDVGQGLAAAHDKGIQHGDFKPANMLIGTDGRTRVADFGIADYLRIDDGGEPRTGRRAGTPKYMAPERLRGHRGDARSDQFSFCVALWRALHGWRPYGGETVFQLLDAIEVGEIRPRVPDARVPHWISEVVRRGLAEDPGERYGDMHELLRALKDEPPDETEIDDPDDDDDSIEHESRVLHAPATPTGTDPQRERWRWVTLVGFLSALVAVMGLHGLTRPPTPQPEPPPAEAVAPYHVILGLVADDKFADAEEYWRDHIAEVSDAEALKIARACVGRSEQLVEPADRAKAASAAFTAFSIANHVHRFGKTDESKAEGGELATEVLPLARSHRPTAE